MQREARKKEIVKVNLGSGNKNLEGFINVDLYSEKADIKHDLDKYPYPFEDNSVDYILVSHVLEHLSEPLKFFKEVYRILKRGGIAKILVPHYKCEAAYAHFGHKRFFHEDAIDGILLNSKTDPSLENRFRLISKKVKRGRIKKWKKKEIIWTIQKP